MADAAARGGITSVRTKIFYGLGSIAFGVSALAAFQLPSSGSIWHLAASNFTTAFGALCFLIGAVLLLPESAASGSEPEADVREVPQAAGAP